MYRLIACDVDGTLLNSKRELTDEVKTSIVEASKLGVKFILSTGRPFQGIKTLLNDLQIENNPHIIYNGAEVVLNGITVFSFVLSKQAIQTIAREGHLRNSTMLCWSKGKLYVEAINEKVQWYKSVSNVEPILIDDLGTLDDVTKFVWYDTPSETAKYFKEMSEKLNGLVNVHPTRVDFLEFVSIDSSKSKALEFICKMLEIPLSETIAVGDGFNDLSIIKSAGLGVAMENAPDEVKNQSDFVTDSCDNNGVKKLIDRFIKNL